MDVTWKKATVTLCAPEQKEWAWGLGQNNPFVMDASRGMQRYGLKVVTVHVRNPCGKGVTSATLALHIVMHILCTAPAADSHRHAIGLPIARAIVTFEQSRCIIPYRKASKMQWRCSQQRSFSRNWHGAQAVCSRRTPTQRSGQSGACYHPHAVAFNYIYLFCMAMPKVPIHCD